MTMPQESDPITHDCPACERPVSCGHELGCERCWCEEFPKLPFERLTGNRCLCRNCLQRALDEHTRQHD